MKKTFLFIASALMAMSLSASNFKVPAFLKAGDTIAVISPAYYASYWNSVGGAGAGFKYKYYRTSISAQGQLAGTDAQRKAEMLSALKDPTVKAIVCVRGGYGSVRFLDQEVVNAMAANPKWMIGYSDPTSIHAAETAAKVLSIHGPMGCDIYSGFNDTDHKELLNLLKGTVPTYTVSAATGNIQGTGTGRLIGGNMMTFAPYINGSIFSAMDKLDDDFILFFEEVGEDYHHIDRLIQQYKVCGLLNRCKGIIVGQFSSCSTELGYSSQNTLCNNVFAGLGIPVSYGFQAGHGSMNHPIIMGAKCTLKVTSSGSTISFNLNEGSDPTPPGPTPPTGDCNEYGWKTGNDMYQALAADVIAAKNAGMGFAFSNEFAASGQFGTATATHDVSGISVDIQTFDEAFFTTSPYKEKWGWLRTYMEARCSADGKAGPISAADSHSQIIRYNLASFFANGVSSAWPATADYTSYGVGSTQYYTTWGTNMCSSTTAINVSLVKNTAVIVDGHVVSVEGGKDIHVYNMQGTLISTARVSTLPVGMYVITVDDDAHKVLIK